MLKETLQGIPGAEAAFTLGNDIFVVAREFGDVDWEKLVEAEDQILAQHPNLEVHFRAHQGRPIDDLFHGCGWKRLF